MPCAERGIGGWVVRCRTQARCRATVLKPRKVVLPCHIYASGSLGDQGALLGWRKRAVRSPCQGESLCNPYTCCRPLLHDDRVLQSGLARSKKDSGCEYCVASVGATRCPQHASPRILDPQPSDERVVRLTAELPPGVAPASPSLALLDVDADLYLVAVLRIHVP